MDVDYSVDSTKAETKSEPQVICNDDLLPDPVPEEISLVQEVGFVAVVCSAQLLLQSCLAQTIPVGQTFGVQFDILESAGEQAWLTASFALAVPALFLIFGRIGDIYGYKLVFLLGFVVMTVSQLVLGFTAYTHSKVFFDVMRAMQGVGFSLAIPNAIALIGHYYPDYSSKKNIVMTIFGSVAPFGFVIGSIITSAIHQTIWWAWSFWISTIVCFIVTVAGYYFIPKRIGTTSTTKFDYLGGFCGVNGMFLFVLAWIQASNVGWDQVYIYVLFIIGGLLLIAFFIIETRVAHPLLPPAVYTIPWLCTLVCIMCGWGSFGIWLVYSFRMGGQLDGWSSLANSVQTIPTAVAGVVAGCTTAALTRRLPTSFLLLFALSAYLISLLLIATRPVGQIYWSQKFVSYIFMPFGMDMSFPVAAYVLSNALPSHDQGIAGSLIATFVNYAIAIGLCMALTVETYAAKGFGPQYLEENIRNGLYMGTGLAGLAFISAMIFVVYEVITKKKSDAKDSA